MKPYLKLKDMNPGEALPAAAAMTLRLGGFSRGAELMGELLSDTLAMNLPGALGAYHRLTEYMLSSPARRVTGDMWRDQLLYEIIQREHPFALLAARGIRDEAQLAAMGERLAIMGELSTLTSERIARLISERGKSSRAGDSVAMKSTAIWSGGSISSLPRRSIEEEQAAQLPLEFTPWKYGEAGLTDSFVSDEALEEMYHRFLEAEDWAELTEDIWNFFASYGTGEFLRRRFFRMQGGVLLPLEEPEAIVPLSACEEQHSRLMENTIRFMRGEKAVNMLLFGGMGTGKTAQAASLLQELPEVRMIIAPEGELGHIPDLLGRLSGQPLKFILLLDDIAADGEGIRLISSATAGFRAIPPNILIYATSREEGGPLPGRITFRYPALKEFTGMISEFLEAEGKYSDAQAIHNAALDYQVDARERLTVTGALMIADEMEE